jgi:hypothetical protein
MGAITFVSDAYGGSASDRQVIEKSSHFDPNKLDTTLCMLAQSLYIYHYVINFVSAMQQVSGFSGYSDFLHQ